MSCIAKLPFTEEDEEGCEESGVRQLSQLDDANYLLRLSHREAGGRGDHIEGHAPTHPMTTERCDNRDDGNVDSPDRRDRRGGATTAWGVPRGRRDETSDDPNSGRTGGVPPRYGRGHA